MGNRAGAWWKRAAGEIILLALGLALTAALTSVLVPIDLPDRVLAREEMNRFYNRVFLRQLIALPLWIGTYFVLHKLSCRWRNRRAR
jgi:fumarate reductase subunit D